MEPENASFALHFADVPDPRCDNGQLRHLLLDILAIALCAVLCGAESFVEMEEFGQAKHTWLQDRLGLCLPHGIPSHDTFGRLFARLNPSAFEVCFERWTQALQELTQGQVIALDGKSLRRSFDRASGQAALHVVSAWASGNRLVLAQQAVESKSNEMTVVPALLERLAVQGCVVTTDALNTQKPIAQQIVDQGADYVLALKANHPLLYQDVAEFFDWMSQQQGGLAALCEAGTQTQEWQHGRHEVRRCFCLSATEEDWPQARRQWPGLQSIVCVESKRRVLTPEPQVPVTAQVPAQLERRFYLSSLPCDAPRLLAAVRSHWGIENSVHWVLDVSFDEDESRIRKDHAPHNMATLRRLALNLLRQDAKHKRGVKTRRHRAAWDSDYLLRILCGT
jgi:predicted transposase YbfD/YdcC